MLLDRQASLPPQERRSYVFKNEVDFERRKKEELELEAKSLTDPSSSDSSSSRTPIVCVCVGFPATPLHSCRVRFCLSSSHTKSDMDEVLRAVDEVGGLLSLKLSDGGPGGRWDVEKVIKNAVQLVEWNGEDVI